MSIAGLAAAALAVGVASLIVVQVGPRIRRREHQLSLIQAALMLQSIPMRGRVSIETLVEPYPMLEARGSVRWIRHYVSVGRAIVRDDRGCIVDAGDAAFAQPGKCFVELTEFGRARALEEEHAREQSRVQAEREGRGSVKDAWRDVDELYDRELAAADARKKEQSK